MADRIVRQGKWENMYGVSLFEKTVGLIGFGRIGSRVARRVQGFRCRVLVHDPFLDEGIAAKAGVELVSMEELLGSSDFISLHLPTTDETRGLIGAEQFGQMKSTAILINTGRGELVQQEALLTALRQGTIHGAGLDAHAQEPPDPAQYEGLDNVVLTPHMGAYTHEALVNMAMGSVENLCAFFEGREPPNVVVPR